MHQARISRTGSVIRTTTSRGRPARLAAVLLLAATPALLVACGGGTSDVTVSEEDLEAAARAIHERIVTIDTHDDIPFNFATEEVDPGVRGDRQVDLPKMREGGLDVGFFIVYVGQGENTPEGYAQAYEQAMTKFDAIHRMTDEMYPDQIELAYHPDDVGRIVGSGKLCAVIGMENGWPVGEDLANLKTFYDLGARYITLAHNGHNQIADSANPRPDEPEELHGGVSDFGERVIAEMNRLGIMVDVSHISKNAMLEAVRLSKAPVIASHSGVRALSDVARNMDDEQLRALADNGGVIQLVALESFVKQTPERDAAIDAIVREETGEESMRAAFRRMFGASEQERAEIEAGLQRVRERVAAEVDPKFPPPNVADFVDHVDYAVKLIGIDHVGISSDFDGGGGVDGWRDASETFNVTLELVRRGYTEEQIAKIWGGNLLRVWREVEHIAAELQAEGDA